MNRKKYYRKEAKRLREIVRERKPHMDSSFNKDDLCKNLGMSPMQLHTMFERNFGMSYSRFMNKLRVEEAKKLLAKPHSREIKKDRISEMSGFGSLSQFNVQFKKITGMTPTEYEIFYRKFKKLTGKSPDQFKNNV